MLGWYENVLLVAVVLEFFGLSFLHPARREMFIDWNIVKGPSAVRRGGMKLVSCF